MKLAQYPKASLAPFVEQEDYQKFFETLDGWLKKAVPGAKGCSADCDKKTLEVLPSLLMGWLGIFQSAEDNIRACSK